MYILICVYIYICMHTGLFFVGHPNVRVRARCFLSYAPARWPKKSKRKGTIGYGVGTMQIIKGLREPQEKLL